MLSKCVVVLLLVAFETQSIYGQKFRKDYQYVKNEKSFYKISSEEKTWREAQISCLRDDAMLFFPENKAEAKSVLALYKDNKPEISKILMGIATWNVEELYETADGRSISNVYCKWGLGEPNKKYGNQSCVVMDRYGTYSIENCNNHNYFICKKTLKSVQWNKECNLPDPSYKYNKDLDRCYKFHLYPQNWTEAYDICKAEDSYLAIINSVKEDQYFIKLIAEAPKDNVGGNYLRGAVHLGYYYDNGIWETIQGVPLEESGGIGWTNSQPDGNGTETCGSMFYTGQLNDIGCWQRMFFLCEHEINSDY